MLDELQEPDVFVSDDNGLAGGTKLTPHCCTRFKVLENPGQQLTVFAKVFDRDLGRGQGRSLRRRQEFLLAWRSALPSPTCWKSWDQLAWIEH